MAKSLRTDPRRIRAARRAAFPAVRARRPRPGWRHPASVADIRAALEAFGKESYYGVELVELVPAPDLSKRHLFGRLVAPRRIVLYDQPPSPWRLGSPLPPEERARLGAAGACIDKQGVVSWPGDTLRHFMLGHVLAHELGHHMLQHERRLRTRRGARTRAHEARAEGIAAKLRARLQ